MHLHRKHLACVKKLEEQRKAAEARSQLAHQWFPELFHQVADGSSLKRSIGNLALMIIAVAEYPSFANRTVTRQRRGEQVGQSPTAPQPILINWLEAQGIQRHLAHSVSHNFRDRSVALDLCQQTPPRWPMTADCHGSVCNSGEPVTMWNPCQIATQNVNSERRRHKKRAHPEAPITMHTLPVRARAGFTAVATISFPVVLASRHLFSISREYSPRRAAWLQRAR